MSMGYFQLLLRKKEKDVLQIRALGEKKRKKMPLGIKEENFRTKEELEKESMLFADILSRFWNRFSVFKSPGGPRSIILRKGNRRGAFN
jgi:hypothetical protein